MFYQVLLSKKFMLYLHLKLQLQLKQQCPLLFLITVTFCLEQDLLEHIYSTKILIPRNLQLLKEGWVLLGFGCRFGLSSYTFFLLLLDWENLNPAPILNSQFLLWLQVIFIGVCLLRKQGRKEWVFICCHMFKMLLVGRICILSGVRVQL